MYNFNWESFTEKDFVNHCARTENDMNAYGDYVGCVRVGSLCFDLTVRDFDDDGNFVLCYDLYVGGINNGGIMEDGDEPYGWSKIIEDYPYEEAEGGDFEDSMISVSYEDFQKIAETAMTEYIDHSAYTEKFNLTERASEPLIVW